MTAIPESAHTIVVPAREGRSAHVGAGTCFLVTDREGGQVGDRFAFSAKDPGEYASAEHTRAHVSRLFPREGEEFRLGAARSRTEGGRTAGLASGHDFKVPPEGVPAGERGRCDAPRRLAWGR